MGSGGGVWLWCCAIMGSGGDEQAQAVARAGGVRQQKNARGGFGVDEIWWRFKVQGKRKNRGAEKLEMAAQTRALPARF